MSLLTLMSDKNTWEKFYNYKQNLAVKGDFIEYLRTYIDSKDYLLVCQNIKTGVPFPLPVKSIISKSGSEKKRVVYTYKEPENTFLKCLTYLILRKYDKFFTPNLFSFRPEKTAKSGINYILKNHHIHEKYSYKADIHNYFNSIPVSALLPKMKLFLKDDKPLYKFIKGLLLQENVIDKGIIHPEEKGIMAGTPISSFLANIYLLDLDKYFFNKNIIYARYSDDIIVFADNYEELCSYINYIKKYLNDSLLTINPSKEEIHKPYEGFVFLGFLCTPEYIDIAPVTLKKLKGKMKRKRDSLLRWSIRNSIKPESAAKAFIRVFNRKLLECNDDNKLSWSKWFFPVITTTKSLHEIDLYAQDCIRVIISRTHKKSKYNVKYEKIKELEYKSLVNEYYKSTR
ncbi:Retron-type reverse transcriptase [Lachnospiraceae bacterium RM5]|nr:Retron-type reverse transcriptase [Lachnospiraceae bacterium RM5]